MKKRILCISLLTMCLSFLCSCGKGGGFKPTTSDNFDIIPLCGTAYDYSDPEMWMYKETSAKHKVDLVYFYPSVVETPTKFNAVAEVGKLMKASAHYALAETGAAFGTYTNIFAPYYTQLPTSPNMLAVAQYVRKYGIEWQPEWKYKEMLTYTEIRTDIYAALDYYFHYCNNGRPFIMAGHSQGSAVCQIVLEEYMRVHPEYLSRMIATYSIGFSVTRSYLQKNSHIKYVDGETDTGVLVSWTTEGPDATTGGVVSEEDSVCINPLNWKKDDTKAEVSENKGMLVPVHWLHSWKVVDGIADAQINTSRGVVVCSTAKEKGYEYEANVAVTGDGSYHTYDYAFYFKNIQINGAKRIGAYLGIDWHNLMPDN